MSTCHAPAPAAALQHNVHDRRGQWIAWGSCAVILFAGLVGLWLDKVLAFGWQPVLGLCAWTIFAGLLWLSEPHERYQALIVVVVATFFEIVGSILWGAYVYRHHNLPSFVPPGHGMVYLFGLRLTHTRLVRAYAGPFVALATAGVLGWGLLGLGVLPRLDVAGAIGAVILAAFMTRSPSGVVYAGVFTYVAFLELYGTALGTWFWLPEVPGIGVPNGNPPSGIAGGYVFFDMAALALTPWVMAAARALRRGAPGTPARAPRAQPPPA
ncbi:MAG: hypothetical protein KDC33_09035 [Thermoleophilia bacterium]|nr:hypothetical protein [Thermoleophilia bacterium]